MNRSNARIDGLETTLAEHSRVLSDVKTGQETIISLLQRLDRPD
ncbi:hypothetical protein [Longimycelium tulufanense]|nr:hypothetical protein [Longimycelium tulufanense]